MSYKSILCNNFDELGECKYGSRCRFAHGMDELVKNKSNTRKRYKTIKCRNFHNKGTCKYGKKCRFIHDETEETLAKLRGEELQQKPDDELERWSPTSHPDSSRVLKYIREKKEEEQQQQQQQKQQQQQQQIQDDAIMAQKLQAIDIIESNEENTGGESKREATQDDTFVKVTKRKPTTVPRKKVTCPFWAAKELYPTYKGCNKIKLGKDESHLIAKDKILYVHSWNKNIVSKPLKGYICPICKQEGGKKISHWKEQCPQILLSKKGSTGRSTRSKRGGRRRRTRRRKKTRKRRKLKKSKTTRKRRK